MPNSNDKVSPGQPAKFPTARLWNEWTDAAANNIRAARSIGLDLRDKSQKGHGRVEILVQSAAGAEAGEAIGFGDPFDIPAAPNDATVASVVFSSANPEEGRWAVARKGLYQNAVGPATLIGVAWAQVDIVDLSHTFADISSGTLKSTASGYAKILYSPMLTGVQLCCLDLGYHGEGSGSGGSCICSIITTMEDNFLISPAQADSLRTGCGCSSPCSDCQTGFAPDTFFYEVTGLTILPGLVPAGDKAEMQADINKLHELFPRGVCTWEFSEDKTLASGNIARYDYELWLGGSAGINSRRVGIRVGWNGEFQHMVKEPTIPYDCFGTENHSLNTEIQNDWSIGLFSTPVAVETTPGNPPPPPPASLSFTTKTALEAADISLYVVGVMVEVTADGSNDGFYIAVGQTGSTPSHWQFLSPPPP